MTYLNDGSELKPCPFCGDVDPTEKDGKIFCSNPECSFLSCVDLHDWQRRPLESKLSKEIDRLRLRTRKLMGITK